MLSKLRYRKVFVLFCPFIFLKLGLTLAIVEKRGIIGGYDAPARPFYVGIKMFAGLCCGGTVITQWHVLTAAHCMKCKNVCSATADK